MELVTATDVGERIGLSAERIRQLARKGDLPAPLGRVGRSDVWRWDDVQAWAIATGRIEPPDDGPVRRAPSVWLNVESRKMNRTVDEVIEWGHGNSSIAHVRIWQPDDGVGRPVVILGELDNNPGLSVTNGIERVADEVCKRWLDRRGLDAEWFSYHPTGASEFLADETGFHVVSFEIDPSPTFDPSGSSRSNLAAPRWHDVTRRQLENVIGQPVEVYEPGTYTSSNANAFAQAGKRIEAEWDPDGLREDLAAAALLDGEVTEANDLDQETTVSFAFASEMLVQSAREKYQAIKEAVSNNRSRTAVKKVVPTLNDAAMERLQESTTTGNDTDDNRIGLARTSVLHWRSWLNEHDPRSAELLLPGPLGLAWPDPRMAGASLPDDDRSSDVSSVADALRLADFIGSWWLWRHDDEFADLDHPKYLPSLPMRTDGQCTTRYLETVSWWGPSREHESRARRLDTYFDPSERGGATGYDPWGRLVRKSRSSELFTVEWPLLSPDSPISSEALVVADEHHARHAVFIELEDGRLDLLPAVPGESQVPQFTWGYYGAGPTALATALHYMCTGKANPRRRSSEEGHLARKALTPLLAEQEGALRIPVSGVSAALEQARSRA